MSDLFPASAAQRNPIMSVDNDFRTFANLHRNGIASLRKFSHLEMSGRRTSFRQPFLFVPGRSLAFSLTVQSTSFSFLIVESFMQTIPTLEVYHPGELTVIGFGGREILDDLNLAECRDDLVDLIQDNGCKVLAFDLTGVRLIPSGLLGLLASIRRLGVEVHLYNACDDIREVLEITKLDQVLELHEVEL